MTVSVRRLFLLRTAIARLALLVLGMCAAGPLLARDTMKSTSGGGTKGMTATQVAQHLAEIPQVRDLEISADGRHVVYTVARADVAKNERVSELLLQALGPRGEVTGAPRQLERFVGDGRAGGVFSPRWHPDGSSLTYFSQQPPPGEPTSGKGNGRGTTDAARTLVRYDLASGRAVPIPFHDKADADTPGVANSSRPPVGSIPRAYQWSPSGQFLTFLAAAEARRALNTRQGVLATASQGSPGVSSPRRGVFSLDVATGEVRLLTPPALHVTSFDWAPDEHALVVAAAPDSEGVAELRTDLYVVTRATGAVRPLVTEPGQDTFPRWSPDGMTIAFASHFGERRYASGWPAVVPARGGSAVRLGSGGDDAPPLSGFISWLPDSRSFLYLSSDELMHRLTVVDIGTRRISPLVGASDTTYVDQFSLSADGRRVAMVRSSLTTAGEVFTQEWPRGSPQQVSRLTTHCPLPSLVRLDRVSWPSRDGRFTIHGLLLTPHAAWAADGMANRVTAPLPTLLFNFGGPGMVRGSFASDGMHGGLLALAARGYAVLAPNTRGRDGYGEAFRRGIRDGQSVGRLPYEDAIEGVDHLVRKGVADPDRLGVYGHSYGGYLTSYIVTQTTRFRAAVVHEGAPVERLTEASATTVPGTDWALLVEDLAGGGRADPWEPEEQARLLAESPLFNVGRVQTPILLQFGAKSGANSSGRKLFGALQRKQIPSELRVYDEGHVFARPAAIADDLTRVSDWFDYWVRGMPYPDSALAARYDAWQASRRGTRIDK